MDVSVWIALAISASGLFAVAWGRSMRKRFLGSPALTCAQAAGLTGPARISGRVVTEKPLAALVTGAECVYYDVEMVTVISDDDRQHTPYERCWTTWSVSDGIGSIKVELGEGMDFETTFATLQMQRPDFAQPRSSLPDRVSEAIIPVGSEVIVTGKLDGAGRIVCGNGDCIILGTEADARRNGWLLEGLGWLLVVTGVVGAVSLW